MDEVEIYAAIGEDGFRRLISEFYRQVPHDDLEAAEERLRDFLVGRFGGPMRYVEQRGHPRLRMRHARFPVDQAGRDRWMQLMRTALDKAAFPVAVRSLLEQYFEQTATSMINRVALEHG
jgi:hemoglobin